MIVTSEIVYDVLQVDGRFSVRERHATDDGVEFFNDYICEHSFDKTARLIANQEALNSLLQPEI